MEETILITNDADEINDKLTLGWLVKSVTSQHVSTGSSMAVEGKFCFVLERPV